jgi:flagellar motor switch protein FliM
MLQELRNAWAPVLELDFEFEQRQRTVQMRSMLHPRERVLCLTFECHVAESAGSLSIIFPPVIGNALLLRLLSTQSTYSDRIPSRNLRRRLQAQLLHCRFGLDLSLPKSPFAIRQLLELEPGHVVVLPIRSADPVHLSVAGKPMFLAYPVRQGHQRGAKIQGRIPLAVAEGEKQE